MAPSAPDAVQPPRARTRAARIGLWVGPALFALALLLPLPLEPAARRTAAVALLMAAWWITEALPLPATALLPLALLPVLRIARPTDAAAPYANPVIFLFLGGFILALALERHGLHRRIALAVIAAVGTAPRRLIGGFMLATASLSMWISNTATTAMMLPIGLAVAAMVGGGGSSSASDRDAPPFSTALMLGIAYAATIGGLATLIGTPPNAVFAAAAAELLGRNIGFAEWMLVGVPLAALLLPTAWALLVYVLHPPGELLPGAGETLRRERTGLGPVDTAGRRVLAVFAIVVAGWLLREPKSLGAWTLPGLTSLAPWLDDSTIAIAGAVLLFLLPSGRGGPLLDWHDAARLPWGVLVLFGGGLSLAAAFESSGLTGAIAGAVTALGALPDWALVMGTVTLFVALSELASNTAMAALGMPVLAAAAAGVGRDPLLLMAVGALAASAAYMMPVATPPNAIVFGSGHIRIGQMVRAGIWLNLVSIVLLTLVGLWLVRTVLV